MQDRVRELVMFDIGIDSNLRGCDLVKCAFETSALETVSLQEPWSERTKASLIYRRTKNLRAVQLLLAHSKLESTVGYLGIEVDDALEIAEQMEA
jgi:hypothetical protein